MKPELSIIVPVYNMEKYLNRCISTILAQTINDYEVICVNDGSFDKSQTILEQYALKDKRICVLEKPNGGLVSARKAGVAVARGDYIGFVDSDDWIEPQMFERLYDEAKSRDADFVSSGYIQEGNYISASYDSIPPGIYREKEMDALRCRMILDPAVCGQGIRGSLCTKLFRSSILREVLPKIPDSLTVAEDKMTTISFLLRTKAAVILREAYYHYILRASSMTHEGNTNYLLRVNAVYQFLQTLYKDDAFTSAMRTQAELYVTQLLLHGINTRLGFSARNLLWIDPYWLKEIPSGKRVALYGGGELGHKYLAQLQTYGQHSFAGCVDFDCERLADKQMEIRLPSELPETSYDFLVITIKDPDKMEEIKERLLALGIPKGKILWFEEREIYWRFAKAEGLIPLEVL